MNALYYPFHLCHEKTLHRLLADFEQVHFRDFMALQLTPLVGTTAFPDRMGDSYPEYLEAGRIVQGHNVSGSMSPEVIAFVDQDLQDPIWRKSFHEFLVSDYRFQRGLFDDSQIPQVGSCDKRESRVLLEFEKSDWIDKPYRVGTVQTLSRKLIVSEDSSRFEYGFALIKTSASLVYTIQLCQQLNLVAVTDSASHHRLLTRSCIREQIELANYWMKREGY
ncbi:MAG: hypothetical protein JSU59_03955 [Nitrospirota bacterium]|nr:MAG: hypothetical protein JSU59_03955 [Nitrospirota bacterium]